MTTDEWRERALAAEGELARMRESITLREDTLASENRRLRAEADEWNARVRASFAPPLGVIETAVDRVRRERGNAPTEILHALPPCAPGCPCATCDGARPEPEPEAWTFSPHHPLSLDPIHE